ncbi:O-antigen/teichoic acid export membrane protein [Aneurinibacillus soli]|uniref:Colanic acid exporter n=1 Tax=Aneurinibacillus soli TaxID=1500254 RepID=A0A0U4WHE2_9BACL|nr:oligosaccharide flippase family protein [Aneurinibacillus soli]PYE64142.1 O-antigen/teichoic acid export membrane protein [Aneurinibacillus soli]BAU28091.1 colanic acid exporter [Aneurinibacillus soli]
MGKKNVFINVVYLLFSHVFIRLFTALAAIAVARYLGAEQYGMIGIGVALIGISNYFTDLGVSQTLIREATKEQADLSLLLSGYIKTRMVLTLVTAIILLVMIEAVYQNELLRQVLYYMVVPSLFGSALQGIGNTYFQVIQKMKYTALLTSVSGVITASTFYVGIVCTLPLQVLASVYGISSLIGGLLSIAMVLKRSPLRRGWDRSILQGVLYFSLGGLAVILLPQLGPIILEQVGTIEQVGYFVAAYRIPAVFLAIPGIVASAFYPLLFQYGNRAEDQEKHLSLGIVQVKLMSFFGIGSGVVLFLFADWWIFLLFGAGWEAAADILRVLSLLISLQAITIPLADSLTTKGYQKRRAVLLSVSVIFSLSTYVTLGHSWGGIGAGMAAIINELFLLVAFSCANPVGWRLIWGGTKVNVLASGMVLLLASLGLTKLHPLSGIPLLLLLYVLLVLSMDASLRKMIQTKFREKRAKQKTSSFT